MEVSPFLQHLTTRIPGFPLGSCQLPLCQGLCQALEKEDSSHSSGPTLIVTYWCKWQGLKFFEFHWSALVCIKSLVLVLSKKRAYKDSKGQINFLQQTDTLRLFLDPCASIMKHRNLHSTNKNIYKDHIDIWLDWSSFFQQLSTGFCSQSKYELSLYICS